MGAIILKSSSLISRLGNGYQNPSEDIPEKGIYTGQRISLPTTDFKYGQRVEAGVVFMLLF